MGTFASALLGEAGLCRTITTAAALTQPLSFTRGRGRPTCGTGRGNDRGVLVRCQRGDLKSTTPHKRSHAFKTQIMSRQ